MASAGIDRMHRNIKPGKGDISTFMDCPDCYENEVWYPYHLCRSEVKSTYLCCEENRIHGKCPRGYAR